MGITLLTPALPEGTPKETRRRAEGAPKELLMWFGGFWYFVRSEKWLVDGCWVLDTFLIVLMRS
ncbi:MAG: hypothetical protein CMC05_12270 [Flavobacteriaceae bacterium]|nr:hypothetical protein [Flavobacteriaceae bacterium]